MINLKINILFEIFIYIIFLFSLLNKITLNINYITLFIPLHPNKF